jgi:hypothetical protein
MTLAKPEYIETDAIGRMIVLYCKVCGMPIARDVRGVFVRSPDYAEIKIEFMDGDKHVTNLCKGCVDVVADDPALLMEVYHADIEHLAQEVPSLRGLKAKLSPRITVVNTKRTGIV